ncbi:DNA methyltransferase [Ruminococcus sp. OM08-7]|nr:DNA methyltransferase [Ruminococcus sp. OM08-7]UWG13371.1 MAG: ParB-like nuclease domain [Bacteriophage sp.]
MKEREIQYCNPEELIPYEKNPRDNRAALDAIELSIEEYGFTNPILVNEEKVILAGHTRREAAILAGLEKVPYIVVDGLTEAQQKAYRLADNKLSELSIWDEDLLKEELEDLLDEDYDISLTGFSDVDLTDLLKDEEDLEDIEPEEPKEKKTTLPMLRFGSNSVRITQDELIMLSNRYNEYVEAEPGEGFVTWLLKRGI